MKGTFGAGLDRIKDAVGHGRLNGSVEVDQAYAKYQHEHPEFHHPDGGGAFYLRDPLFERIDETLQSLADKTINSDGTSGIESAMIDFTEALSKQVYDRAPVEFADLKASGHPKVTSDGDAVYDRQPLVPRLTEEELRIKQHLRDLFEPGRYRR